MKPKGVDNQDELSEDNWIVKSLNIHGTFFERLCASIVRQAPHWTLTTTNYPVEVNGNHSELDIRADAELDESLKLRLLIECKKNNPDFIKWVFFRKPDASSELIVPGSDLKGVKLLRSPPLFPFGSVIANDAREVRGCYQAYKSNDKTKTSNAAITDASKQISLATEQIWAEEWNSAKQVLAKSLFPPGFPRTFIFPVIVTTAQLHACDFDPADIDLTTGEIPYEKVKLSKALHTVVYEYALPRDIHQQPVLPLDDRLVRRHIVVVHSTFLAEFMQTLLVHMQQVAPAGK